MGNSWLPKAKPNLFQGIRAKRSQLLDQGMKLVDLSIGEPRGPALLSARQAAAQAVMSEQEDMHRYQYNDSPGVPGFSKNFVESMIKTVLNQEVSFLPIPGIKRMLGLIPLACGSWNQPLKIGTMTKPGYTFIENWCTYLGLTNYPLLIDVANTFRFRLQDIESDTKLIMTNYPHNPSGRVSDKRYWEDLCEYCSENSIRLFNDAAYYGLSHSDESCSLTEVAVQFPELSWCEAFTAAKLVGNATGWQVGAIAGSPDFISDISVIKGNTDEGFVAPMAAGVNASVNSDWEGILGFRETYRTRMDLLIDILIDGGLKLAIKPEAGFFTLWMVPKEAFGQKIESAEHFNLLMMEHSGIIGVHFEPLYIRYAVCEDITAYSSEIAEAFKKAKLVYI